MTMRKSTTTRNHTLLFLCAAAIASLSLVHVVSTTGQTTTPNRSVTVTATLTRMAGGGGIAGAVLHKGGVIFQDWDTSTSYGVTEADGTTTLSPYAVTTSEWAIRLRLGYFKSGQHAGRWSELIKQMAFLDEYQFSLAPNQQSVQAAITVRDGTNVSGSVTCTGYPTSLKTLDGATVVGHDTFEVENLTDNTVKIHGVPKDVPYTLEVGMGMWMRFVDMPATNEPATFPAQVFNHPERTVPVHIGPTRPGGTLGPNGEAGGIGVAFLRTDGTEYFKMIRGDLTRCTDADAKSKYIGINGTGDGWVPFVKPGEYWVIPTAMMNSWFDIAFRQMLVAGRDVSACNLPRVTAVAGQPITMTYDHDLMSTRYYAFTRPLVESKLPIAGPDVPNFVPPVPTNP